MLSGKTLAPVNNRSRPVQENRASWPESFDTFGQRSAQRMGGPHPSIDFDHGPA
jgi:hypothetical protein